MPEIKLEHVTKRWGKFYAVDDLDLVIQDNAFVTLLGPSGCGKTTTLRMIAGLETPTSGRITIGDQVVFDSALGINIPANKRKVGFLFQNYALWPNMTVYENISFGLKNIKEPLPKVDFEAKNAARLAEILEQPAEVVRVLEECRDKDGRLDQKKAQLKLVDTFTISIYTAKQLLSYRLEQSPDLSGEIASLRGRVEAARQSAAAAGGELDIRRRVDDDRAFAAQLQSHRRQMTGCLTHDLLAHRLAAGEEQQVVLLLQQGGVLRPAAGDHRHVLRPLHPPLDLQAGHPHLLQLAQVAGQGEVFQGEGVGGLPVPRPAVGQAAGLGAQAPVARAAPDGGR